MNGKRSGFTAVEIMLVVAIIGLLAVMSYPWARASIQRAQRSLCVTQLSKLSHATDRYFMANNQLPASFEDLMPDFIKEVPMCPSGGEYTLATMDLPVQCSRTDLGHIYP